MLESTCAVVSQVHKNKVIGSINGESWVFLKRNSVGSVSHIIIIGMSTCGIHAASFHCCIFSCNGSDCQKENSTDPAKTSRRFSTVFMAPRTPHGMTHRQRCLNSSATCTHIYRRCQRSCTILLLSQKFHNYETRGERERD